VVAAILVICAFVQQPNLQQGNDALPSSSVFFDSTPHMRPLPRGHASRSVPVLDDVTVVPVLGVTPVTGVIGLVDIDIDHMNFSVLAEPTSLDSCVPIVEMFESKADPYNTHDLEMSVIQSINLPIVEMFESKADSYNTHDLELSVIQSIDVVESGTIDVTFKDELSPALHREVEFESENVFVGNVIEVPGTIDVTFKEEMSTVLLKDFELESENVLKENDSINCAGFVDESVVTSHNNGNNPVPGSCSHEFEIELDELHVCLGKKDPVHCVVDFNVLRSETKNIAEDVVDQGLSVDLDASVLNCKVSQCYDVWARELASDCDKDYLLEGIMNGFEIVDCKVSDSATFRKNYKSTQLENKLKEEKRLLDEIEEGHYVVSTNKPLKISALGVVPKGTSDVRVIHDLSRPDGGVNQFAIETSVSYITINDAVKMISPTSYLAKT
jgi:hypothetical protein